MKNIIFFVLLVLFSSCLKQEENFVHVHPWSYELIDSTKESSVAIVTFSSYETPVSYTVIFKTDVGVDTLRRSNLLVTQGRHLTDTISVLNGDRGILDISYY